MTPKKLTEIGQALFGHRWKSPMADVLNRDKKQIRRWADKDSVVPDWVEVEIYKFVKARVTALRRIVRRMK